MPKRSLAVLSAFLSIALPALADTVQYDEESRAVAQELTRQMGGEMRKALEAGGLQAAIDVCRNVEPEIASRVSVERGWKVTRVATRVRNPLLGTPDAWEQGTLAQFEKRLRAGEEPGTIEFSQIVDEPYGRSYRYMKAIIVQPGCLACHGAPSDMSDDVKATLARLYPHDRATGYRAGELRGAVSIKRPLDGR